jgi:hypothetical protein
VSSAFESLIRAVDALEDRAASYVTLEEVRNQKSEVRNQKSEIRTQNSADFSEADVSAAVRAQVLLVDHRTRADGTQVTLCRLNRRHPDVVRLTGW